MPRRARVSRIVAVAGLAAALLLPAGSTAIAKSGP